MKTVWTLNVYDGYFDYELFNTREKAVKRMNERKEAMIKNRFVVHYENEQSVTLISEKDDKHLFNYTYDMWINEKVVY